VLWANPAGFEKALGDAIERTRSLGATHVIVDAGVVGAGGRLEAVWFPNRVLPVKADILTRLTWQIRTRAGVQVVVALPVQAAHAVTGGEEGVLQLFEDLGISTLADALLLDQAPALASIPASASSSGLPWAIRQVRNSLNPSQLPAPDFLAFRAFMAFESIRPGRRLFLMAQLVGQAPSAVADLTLVEAPSSTKPFRQLVDDLGTAGWLAPPFRYLSGVVIHGEKPPSADALSSNVRLFQRRGGVAFGWEPDDPVTDEPKAAAVAPSVSAARFPIRF
jgi:biofilm PGA synthesis lipoprotein PgaB